MSAEQERVQRRLDARAYPGIEAFRKYFSSGKDAENAFIEWRKHGCTRLLIAALEDLIDSPTPISEDCDTNRVLVQSGMTAGLTLAHKLATRPQRIFPEVFSGTNERVDDLGLDLGYIDTPESFLDSMIPSNKDK